VKSRNPQALRVKLADLYDNLSPARNRSLPRDVRGIRHRFAKDVQRVVAALNELGDELHGTIVEGDL
jgi:hypothetical protein